MGSIVEDDLVRRRKTFAQRRSLSEYAVSLPSQPSDAFGIHPKDDKFRFFKKGRDFQPRHAKHQFTEDELQTLQTYESAAILPSHSEVYRKWLENEPPRGRMESWTILSIVSILTGTLAFILRLICEKFQIIYIPFIQNALETNDTLSLSIYYTIASCGFGSVAAIVIIYFCPHASGSGLPEIIGILNGCVVRNVLSFKTLICKMISVIFVVISKLPVGFEGPMVHIGAMVGACMAKPIQRCFHNDSSNGCCPKIGCVSRLCRYRDCQERYSLICVGAASGVASAFSSPISGLTFAMEEISSHWSRKDTWRTFVCCVLARSTTELLRSLETTISEFNSGHAMNILHLPESALFDMKHDLNLSLLIFIPALIIGAVGGLLGAVFIFIHLKASKLRRKLFSYIQSTQVQNVLKLFEVILIAAICSSFIVSVLHLSPCKEVNHQEGLSDGRKSLELQSYRCQKPLNSTILENGQSLQAGEYNQGASLLLGSWEQMIRNLLSRQTFNYFEIPVICACFVCFWTFSCWTSMTNVACGLLIPQLAIGAIYGRLMGELLHSSLKGIMERYENVGWEWVDPGAFALMGAASFLSGTSRLPITSVVMVVEMTNINMSLLLLLVMVCVMMSKFVGDLLTHSIYHSVLEIKCIPYLEPDLKVYDNDGLKVSLELFTSSTVMKSPVQFVGVKESVKFLANLLLDTNHGAFPVVNNDDGMEKTYLGIITRLELTILLTKTERFDPKEIEKDDMDRLRISYPEYSSTKLKNASTANMVLNKYSSNIVYKNIYVNLKPYINVSAPSVPSNFCLRRTYMMFTAMGLRHLVVTDRLNQVIGIITRKDLMGFSVEDKIRAILLRNKSLSFSQSSVSTGPDCDIEVQSTVPIVEEENEDN